MEAHELYPQFLAFAKAARDDLEGGDIRVSRVDRSVSDAIATLNEEEFRNFWGRVSRDGKQYQKWIERLARGYKQEKERVATALDAASKGSAKSDVPDGNRRGAA